MRIAKITEKKQKKNDFSIFLPLDTTPDKTFSYPRLFHRVAWLGGGWQNSKSSACVLVGMMNWWKVHQKIFSRELLAVQEIYRYTGNAGHIYVHTRGGVLGDGRKEGRRKRIDK